jgi:hypothetical protein
MVFVGEHGTDDAARRAGEAIRWRIGSGAAVGNARHDRAVTESFANRHMFAMVEGRSRDRLYDF